MSPRYLLLLGKEGPPARALVERLAARTGLIALYASGRLVALVNTACGCISLGESGCILGWLFHRHGPAQRLASLTEIDAAHVVRSEGEALLRMFWGGYVAAIAGADSLVLRDPSGTFPCYYVTDGELVFIASDADLLALAGIPIDLELEEVGRQLYRAFVPSQATAMRGVRELLAGFALRLSSTAERQQPCWRPWDHVQEASSRATDGSAERFSRVIQHSVAAWASESGRLLLSVSGGLDSSIIAACLARARTDTVCLTMFSNDPAGDERAYARTLCNHLGLPLIERPYRLEDIDITEPLAAHLPRPRDRTQANAYERVHIEVASEIGAGAFVTGNGGDHVLGYSQSAAPIADRYLVEGLGAGVVRSLRDVCRQTGCSIFDALWQAWRLAHSSPHRPIVPNPLFLDQQFIASVKPTEMHHPWLDAPPDALPGKAAHISTILRVQPNLEASRGAVLPVFSPLVSQPVIEACLSIPSWEWRAGGRDRSLARRAFAGALPAAIVNRRVKGTPSRFAARLLDHFRAQIRDRVLRGRLAANGVVDRAALGLALAGERPVGDLERVRILEIVNAEAWLDHWAARKSSESAEPQVRSGGHGRTPSSTCPTP